ncbi:MAG: hypothetical protein ACI4PH_11545 [Faecousia sp.]
MKGPYDDIIHMPHHVSATRKRMSLLDRAAQFSPFAALTGYDAAIRETGRLTDNAVDLDVDGKAMLNETLQRLFAFQETRPEVTVTYFVPDERKTGGAYATVTGYVKKLDPYSQVLLLTDGTEICFSRILEIEGEQLRQEL